MPACLLDNVPCSEMRGSNTHQGPRTAGNKSLLSYRSDIGVPGYTGYCPGWITVPVPITGGTERTGKLPAGVPCAAGQLGLADQGGSVYASTFRADPAAYKRPSRSVRGGGYWFEDRQRAASAASPPFAATSTSRAELGQGAATAAAQLEASRGLSSTLVGYQVARDHRALSAGAHLTRTGDSLSAFSAATSTGQLIGYQTTYARASCLAADRSATAAVKASGGARPASCSAAERARAELPPGSPSRPRFASATSYSRDYGTQGADPMLRLTSSSQPHEASLAATTRELSAGTTRAAHHPPGYTGKIPASASNEGALAHGLGCSAKPNTKALMLPAELDQFSRGRLSGYTGYKPRSVAAGATAVQPAQGPTLETTQGFVNLQVLKAAPSQRPDSKFAFNSRKGLLTFFTGGGESQSDNGLADAQRFFAKLRPMEGRVKTFTPSATNSAGGKYSR